MLSKIIIIIELSCWLNGPMNYIRIILNIEILIVLLFIKVVHFRIIFQLNYNLMAEHYKNLEISSLIIVL